MIVEVCCNSIASAEAAQAAGAQRIEFCTGLALGGLTPSWGVLEEYMALIHTPTRVLIRPREGDFTYSASEFSSLLKDIEHCKTLGFEGVVSGVLTAQNELDEVRTKELVCAATKDSFTFHRAFDWIQNPLATIEKLASMGVHTLLSSGGVPKAIDGLPLLKELMALNTGITIMPGSGVNVQNVRVFKEAGFKAVHLSGVAAMPILTTTPPVSFSSVALLSDTHRYTTQQKTIEDLLEIAKG